MKTLHIGVPPGVGDVYWTLCKLEAFKAAQGADRIVLCPQQTGKPRALQWANMVEFVDEAVEYPFAPNQETLETGISRRYQVRDLRRPAERAASELALPFALDYVLWPNAIVDREKHLVNWLPKVKLNLDIEVRVDETAPRDRVVVFASSVATQRAWLPATGPTYWAELINRLGDRFDQRPLLIGASWDDDMRQMLIEAGARCEDLVESTSLMRVAGILKHARVVVGLISGMTILANHYRTPCIALHPDKHRHGFVYSWIKPETPYQPIANSVLPTPMELAQSARKLADLYAHATDARGAECPTPSQA